jgi:hypothetical protein
LNRSIRHRRGWLDHDLHRLPNRAHCRNDSFLAHGHDVVHVSLNDSKVWFANICAQPIGDGELLFSHKPASCTKRLRRIIRILRLDRDHLYLRPHRFRSDRCAGQQTATADRAHDHIKVGDIFQLFHCCCPLPCYHVLIFE